ncbi:unnamed protein product [Peronospora belbahrii]|uniref:Uncharacterized protein n=1 Tax=Peronospora belbahrii TaxID=622444 RepID=A0AAU9L5U0_9STRA|nr:unnamed protein product [Peronospora belbahrii]
MDDLYTEHVESADKTSIQDQMVHFEEMAKFVNARIFELFTEKMNDGNKRTTERKDFMTAGRMKRCVDEDTNEIVKDILLIGLESIFEYKYNVEDEVAVALAEAASKDIIKKYVPKKSLVQKKTPE